MTIDLDYLKHRERIERMRSRWGSSDESRAAHKNLADTYGARIRELSDLADDTMPGTRPV